MSSLAAEEKLTADVRPVEGTPTLFINGKPHNPLIYMPGAWGRCVGSVPVRITTEWKSFETTFGMPEDQPNGSVYVQVGKVSGTTVWVDDVSLVDADEPQKNLIANADFSDTNWEKDWVLDTMAKEGAKATARVEDGALRLDVDGGGNEFRHVRIFYRGKLDLKKRPRYIYSLRLRASKERDADILVREQGGNWTVYSEGPKWKTLHTIEHAAREGVHIHLVSAVGMPWPRTGQQPDYRAAEWTIEQHLARDPQGLLIVAFPVDPPSWWKEKHPDDLMVWENPSDRTITLKRVETAQSPLDWHRVRVELKGGSIRVYLDGELKIEYVDPQPLPCGKVELNSLHAKCRFDDVKVSDFAGKTLFADDFSSGLEKWKAEEGRWHVEGGELVGEGMARLKAGESNWQDYVLEVRMKTDEVGIDPFTHKQEPWCVGTLYFRYTDLDHRYILIFRSDGSLELLKRHKGARLLTTNVEHGSQVWQGNQVSVASEAWRREANEHARRFIEHLESKYGDRIIGYKPWGQNTGEWFYQDSHQPKLTCCEPVFEKAWRTRLREKYGTEDALRKAWGDPNITFDKVAIPSAEQRLNASLGFFRDPGKERKVIDFHEYQSVAMVEALGQFAKTIKDAANRRKLVIARSAALFDVAGQPYGVQGSGQLAFSRLLKCPDVDLIAAPISYGDRGAGGIGAFMWLVDSVSLHGKLWFHEDDSRTHLSPSPKEDKRPDPALCGGVETPEQTYGVHQRNFAHLLTRRMSCWWMDLFGDGWLDDEGIWQNLGKLKRLYDSVLGKPSPFKPEIAVIVDEKSNFYLTQGPPPLTKPLLYGIHKSLYRTGAPCGFYLLDDLTSGLVPKAKLYIFLNCFALTEGERQAIARQCEGKVCAFFYANGFIKDPSTDARNMEELLGVPMRMGMEKVVGQVKVAAHSLTEGVSDFGVDDAQYALSPVFYLEEAKVGKGAKTEVLGRYRDNGMPAVWVKRDKPYTCVYIGALTAPASLLRNIAKTAGAHIYCETDDVIAADGEFLAIHASAEGQKQLMLPRKATVRDALSGEVVGVDIQSWRLKMQKGETRLYSIGKARTK